MVHTFWLAIVHLLITSRTIHHSTTSWLVAKTDYKGTWMTNSFVTCAARLEAPRAVGVSEQLKRNCGTWGLFSHSRLLKTSVKLSVKFPRCSIYGTFTYIYLIL